MRTPWNQLAGVTCVVVGLIVAQSAQAQLWRQFLPSGSSAKSQDAHAAPVHADRDASAFDGGAPATETAPAPTGEFALTQDRGPWLIVAATFSGDGAEKQSHELAAELRSRYRIPAYVCEMSFKFGDNNPGQGVDSYGAPTRRRFRRGDQAREIAVLVGDFQSIEDQDAQQMLGRIKSLETNALNVDPSQSAQTMAQIRQMENSLIDKLGKGQKRGPMSQAFFTHNPLLPQEYFVPKGVDSFVAKMNDGVEHSLLDCPGRQTIKVATFRGKTILQTSAQDDQPTKSFWGKKKEENNPLIEAAENAHLLCKELRDHGWEAYEFHDRTESIVTIGSFAEVTQKQPDGRVLVVPQVQKIVQTFDAGFDTPSDPLTGIGNDTATRQRVAEQEQQVSMQLGNKQAQVVPGMNPKHVKIMHGHGKNAKLDRIIPMDVHPEAIDVPKRSISSAYAGQG
jgi:hypothetical protein